MNKLDKLSMKITTAITVAVIVSAIACSHNTNNQPTLTPQQKALATIGNVIEGFKVAQSIEKAAFQSKLLTADENKVFDEATFKFVAILHSADKAALASTDATNAKQQVVIVSAALNELVQSGVVGIKNTNKKTEISAALSPLQTILIAFGGSN